MTQQKNGMGYYPAWIVSIPVVFHCTMSGQLPYAQAPYLAEIIATADDLQSRITPKTMRRCPKFDRDYSGPAYV